MPGHLLTVGPRTTTLVHFKRTFCIFVNFMYRMDYTHTGYVCISTMKCENLPRARLKLWFLVWAAKSNLLKVKTIILNTTTQISAYDTDQIQKKFCPGTHKLRLWNCVVCCSLYSRFIQSVHFSRAFPKNWNVTLLRHLKHNGFQSCVKIHRLVGLFRKGDITMTGSWIP